MHPMCISKMGFSFLANEAHFMLIITAAPGHSSPMVGGCPVGTLCVKARSPPGCLISSDPADGSRGGDSAQARVRRGERKEAPMEEGSLTQTHQEGSPRSPILRDCLAPTQEPTSSSLSQTQRSGLAHPQSGSGSRAELGNLTLGLVLPPMQASHRNFWAILILAPIANTWA